MNSWILAGFLSVSLVLGTAAAGQAPKKKLPLQLPPGVTAHRGLEYIPDGHERHQLDLFVPGQAASFATVTHAATARASTMFNAGRQLGGAVGVAVLSTVISAVGVTQVSGGHRAPNATAYHLAFLTAAWWAGATGLSARKASESPCTLKAPRDTGRCGLT